MPLPLNTPINDGPRIDMERTAPEEREYEALSTVRDVLLLLYSEISENTGMGCERLRSAYEYLRDLTVEAGNGL